MARRKVSEFRLADELMLTIANHLGRRASRLDLADKRDLNDRCLELARHACALEPAPSRPAMPTSEPST